MRKKWKQSCLLYALTLLLFFCFSCNIPVYAADTATQEQVSAYTLKTADIPIRDPYVVVYEGKYYMYGTDGTNAFGGNMDKFMVYVSEDLKTWSEPYTIYQKEENFWADAQYWAPEVFVIDNTFYLYGSMGGSKRQNKGIQLFKADNPLGPFVPASEYPFTPEQDDDIDATLYQENNKTYMLYSQGSDGIYAVELNNTYDGFAKEPFKLFDVAENGWAVSAFGNFILNDGPCLYKTSAGTLICFYSTMTDTGYNMGMAVSDNGKLDGNWSFKGGKLLASGDGGHCMIFKNLSGQTMICYHTPNGNSRPAFKYLIEDTKNDTVYFSDVPKPDVPEKPEKEEIPAKSMKVSVTKAALGIGEKLTLKITVNPSNTTDKLTCTSSRPSVAKVSKKGVIQAKKKGTAEISITSGKITKKVKITVKKAPSKITLKKNKISLKKNKKYQIHVKLPSKSASYKITYKSSNSKIASVSSSGMVKAKKKGQCKITVKTFNGKKQVMRIKVK